MRGGAGLVVRVRIERHHLLIIGCRRRGVHLCADSVPANDRVATVDRMASWWDGFELWIAGLPFVPQVALVLLVMVPVCRGLAWLLDRGLAAVFVLLRRDVSKVEEP